MNIRLVTIIATLFFFLIFGFEKPSFSNNTASQDNISELKILKFIPKNNKILFISNYKSEQIINNLRKNYKAEERDNILLIKNNILAYLGIDIGTNNLEEIYNDELTISTYENKEKDIDDILIIFKINEKKDIDDILNLANKVDEPNQLIKIFRENKLNFLNYIYRTNDNYILTSSNKRLILEALKSKKINQETETINRPFQELLSQLKNEKNILLTKDFKTNKLLYSENKFLTKDNYLATLFVFKDKVFTLKSYLLNNTKGLDIMSYEKIVKENKLDKINYQIYIYNDLLKFNQYLEQIKINSFEKDILMELNEKLKQNYLFLFSENNWFLIFDKNNLSIENIKLLEDFNKYSLENNNNIYTIYSKDILKKDEDIIKQSSYKNIFSAESKNLIFISNSLINDQDIDSITKEFLKIKGDSNASYILNKRIDLKDPYSIQYKKYFYLESINYFFKKIINLSIIEFKAIIKQSIPETIPIFYTEKIFKIF